MVYLAIIGIPIGTRLKNDKLLQQQNNFMTTRKIIAFLVTFLLAFGHLDFWARLH
jgi:hypothetical protein